MCGFSLLTIGIFLPHPPANTKSESGLVLPVLCAFVLQGVEVERLPFPILPFWLIEAIRLNRLGAMEWG